MNSEGNKDISNCWGAKLSISHWLAIVAVPTGIIGALYLFWQEEKTLVKVYVPTQELSAYHQIQPADLVPKLYASRSVASDSLKTSQEILGRYTLFQIPKGKPLTRKQLGVKLDPDCLKDTVAVSLPATTAMIFGGNLKPGHTVSITFGFLTSTKEVIPLPTTFSDILVIDVKAVSQANASPTSIIVIALPEKSVKVFATHLAGTPPLISHSLSPQGNSCVL